MKKYWKLIVLTIFTFVVFCVFYINAKTVTNSFPQFSFHKLEGDDKAVESLVVNGDLYRGMFNIEAFKVDAGGTEYLRDKSFIDRISMYYRPLEIERLQKEHRNFMRGKEEDLDAFFENDDVLAYGATPYDSWSFDNYKFEIAVLDKHTNKATSFSLPIPNRGDYWSVDSYGVTFSNNKLSMVTLNSNMNHSDGVESTEAHMYTFDTETEQLINEEVIAELSSTSFDSGYEGVDVLLNDKSDEDHVIIYQSLISYTEPTNNADDLTETVQVKQMIKYNIRTNESEEVPLPENENLGMPLAFLDEHLYFANNENKNLQLTSYDMNEKKIKDELEVQINDAYFPIGDFHQALVKDDTLYLVPSSVDNDNGMASIVVADLKSLTLNYYGQIENTNLPKDGEQIEMYFNYPELRN